MSVYNLLPGTSIPWIRTARLVAGIVALVCLAACGGGGGSNSAVESSGSGNSNGSGSTALPLMVDSLGRTVPEALFAQGDAAAAGVDGTAGDGLPIANAPVTLIDSAGNTASTFTDSSGYYRINAKGFVSPMIAKVQRPNGMYWFSPAINPVVRRGFTTVNINGLTDKLAGEVAESAGVRGGAARLTPATLARNLNQLKTFKAGLSELMAAKISAVGLNPDFFDPVTSRFEAVASDPYDRLLENLQLVKNQATGLTDLTLKFSLSGSVAGLTGTGGITLRNGTETINIEPGSKTFSFARQLATGTGYNVTVGRQPASGLTCSVNRGSGTVGQTDVVNIAVVCGASRYAVGGTIAGLGAATGLTLSNGIMSQTILPNQSKFLFQETAVTGAAYSISIASQPAGRLCSIANSSGTMAATTVDTVLITCSTTLYTVGGTISGLNANGLVLVNASQAYSVPSGTANFVLGSAFAMGTTYAVTVQTQPTGLTCTVTNGTGTVGDANVGNININCVAVAAAMVSTFAGSATAGLVDGSGGAARFTGPANLALDGGGNIYVADTGNHAIRKIDSTGEVSTLAGSGVSGNTNATGTAAQFNAPVGIAVDATGNVYVGDTGNSTIRKISPAGVVTTFATGVIATGLVLDTSGNLYAADSVGHKISKVTAAGVVSTLAGSGTAGLTNGAGTAAAFNAPRSIAMDGGGNLFVADSLNNVIRKVTPGGTVTTAVVGLSTPKGIALDSAGNYYVAQGLVVFKVTPTSAAVLAGTGASGMADGPGTSASFSDTRGLAVDANNNVYVADTANNAIRKIAP